MEERLERGRLHEVVAGAAARGVMLTPREAAAIAGQAAAAGAAAGVSPASLTVGLDGQLAALESPTPAPGGKTQAFELARLLALALTGRVCAANELPPDLTPPLRAVLGRALAADAERRYADPASLASAVGQAVADPLPAAELPALWERLHEARSRVALAQIPVARVPAPAAAAPAPTPAEASAAPAGPRNGALRGKRLGEILVARGRLDPDGLDSALARQRRLGGRLGEILVANGMASESDVIRALSEQTGIPFVSDARLAAMEVPAAAVALVPVAKAERLQALPLTVRGKELFCAMREPRDLAVLDELQFVSGMRVVRGVFATEGAIRRGLRRFYHGGEDAQANAWEKHWPGDGAQAERQGPQMLAGGSWASFPGNGGDGTPPAGQPFVATGSVQGVPLAALLAGAPPFVVVPTPAAGTAFSPAGVPVAAQPVPLQGAAATPWPGIGAGIPEALVLEPDPPAALLLEEEAPPAVLQLRERLLALALERLGGVGALPLLVRRLGERLEAPRQELELAVAAAEAVALVAGGGEPFRAPTAAALRERLGAGGAAAADLLDSLATDRERPAAAALQAALAFTEASGSAAVEPNAAAHLPALAPDLAPRALLALAAEVAGAFAPELPRVLVAGASPERAAPLVAALLAAGLPTLVVEEAVELRLALDEPLGAVVLAGAAAPDQVAAWLRGRGDVPVLHLEAGQPSAALVEAVRAALRRAES